MLNYAVQYDKYQERCENKDKPQLDCNGSCQLSNEIASIGSDEAAPELSNLTEYFIPVFYQEECDEMFQLLNAATFIATNYTLPRCCVADDIDHPPQVA